jgi:hypothetical protein
MSRLCLTEGHVFVRVAVDREGGEGGGLGLLLHRARVHTLSVCLQTVVGFLLCGVYQLVGALLLTMG